ncbi:hypothetical protein, partial [Pseudomonas sp. 2822-17]|uniref:hypothetical protein n=1 Tax=Pseudomonas sp. 2822-17 TaxID=1712678 RepID=UPI000C4109D3
DVGIQVSREEAIQQAEETREIFEELWEDENAVTYPENLELIKSEYEELGLYEDNFWTEYGLSSYAYQVMRSKVMDYELGENP